MSRLTCSGLKSSRNVQQYMRWLFILSIGSRSFPRSFIILNILDASFMSVRMLGVRRNSDLMVLISFRSGWLMCSEESSELVFKY